MNQNKAPNLQPERRDTNYQNVPRAAPRNAIELRCGARDNTVKFLEVLQCYLALQHNTIHRTLEMLEMSRR